MKKHLLVCLLALVLASLCMLPSQVQAAETETHDDHCACGADHVSIGDHTTDSSSWTNWTALTPDSNGHVKWPEGGNYYYLTDNVVLTETWKVPETNAPIVLCLNGHNITMEGSGPAIEVNGTSTSRKRYLTITDCEGTGKITRAANANDPVCGCVDTAPSPCTAAPSPATM